jgi:hypothetical protein
MARQVLDESEAGAYTGDGGTSNNGKCNANFAELFAVPFVVAIGVKPGASGTIALVHNGPGQLTELHFRAISAATSALGDVRIMVVDGEDDSVIVADVSIKGQTMKVLTIEAPGHFDNGLFIEVNSTHADAVAGVGMQISGVYTKGA